MKIALVHTEMPLGGTTTASIFLISGLQQFGVTVKVFSLSKKNPLEAEFTRLGIPVFCCDDRKLIFEDRLAALLEELRDFAPSCVIAGLAPPAFEVLRYVPESIFRIGLLQDHHPQVYQMAERYHRFVDCFGAVSSTIKSEMDTRFPNLRCSFLPYGVPVDPKRQRKSALDGSLKVLYFGRLAQTQKQVRRLPDIWRSLKSCKIPSKWTILGEGPESDFLRQSMAEGIESHEISFSAPIFDRNKLSDVIGAHDIFLLCSIHEGLPLALLEAMGQGLVPVCGDIPSLANGVITLENGFLVKQDEAAAYAEAIGLLHQTRPLLENMSVHARDTILKDYTEVAMARRYLALIEGQDKPREGHLWTESPFKPRAPLGMENVLYMSSHLVPLRRLIRRFR
jgi:glycosyltransferase involved in cell wall biosynthesis